ncbi:Rpn family recombination-promoting nuclease/putative transposase [Bacillus toyonensis]|uniref:Rpn family recombination-promoting nuclease/putative transposase n=1 Tax=Bacillus toyonensis TaxID=155322 RepID=UPI0026FA67C3|nr:Rpn family recombination-promoting nuclease/putative transposase [Bacillus toyonensis]MDO8156032.1 Rpn family recombination-promoting nuclease/putative transposase [Bacillus toyonensis]
MNHKRIDLRVDFAFKAVFGTPGSEMILVAFLNALLRFPENQQIQTLQLVDTHLNPVYKQDKKSILDVRAKLEDGSNINVEIQLQDKEDMDARTLFYWSKMYTEPLQSGDDYTELCRTITINLINYSLFHETMQHHSVFRLYEETEQFLLTDLMEIHFVELPKFLTKWKHGDVHPSEDQLVRWLLLIEAAEQENITPVLEAIAMKEDPILHQAMETWDRVSQDPELRREYEARRKALMDEKAALRRAENKGREEGIHQGKEEGKMQLIRGMHKNGMEIEDIAKFTTIEVAEIRRILQKL